MAPAGAGLLELWRSGCDLFVRSTCTICLVRSAWRSYPGHRAAAGPRLRHGP